MRHALVLAIVLVAVVAPEAAADRDDAFCEVTPCLNGPITRRTLKRDEKLGRLWCKRGQDAGVDGKGRLAFCTTARAQTIDGLKLAAGAYTLVHPNGRVYQTHLRAAQTFTLADGSTVTCAADLVALTPAGVLTFCELKTARPVAPGVTARAGESLALHPNGRVFGATLDGPATIAGLALPAGTQVTWDDGGVMSGGSLAAPMTIQGLGARGDFALHASGRLRAVVLADDATVQGHAFPAFAKLELREDGSLAAAEYVEDRGFMIHGEMWTDTAHVTYDAAGQETSHTVEHWQAEEPPPRFRRGGGKRP